MVARHCGDCGVVCQVECIQDELGDLGKGLPRREWHQERPFSETGRKGRFPGPWDEALLKPAPAAV